MHYNLSVINIYIYIYIYNPQHQQVHKASLLPPRTSKSFYKCTHQQHLSEQKKLGCLSSESLSRGK